MNEINEEVIFKLISFSGDARSDIYEAFELVKKGKYAEAQDKFDSADEAIIHAHNTQTSLIKNEINGNHVALNLLLVHAQDHLMNTLLAKDMVKNMINMQKEINELKDKLK
ncbi:MAG: lactose/cellobiose transporter subunit [Clostridiaceae bacterium]|jgi:cellobiose-specific phosphotransferase system component IIA|nr:lactose/cellobiose transporter subunit [Clostridiaceae bacterium]